MILKKLFFACFITIISLQVQAQTNHIKEKIVPPSEGKTVIYFVRTTGLGSLINFRYFDGEKYLGKFNGRSYLRYECEPGEHIFWLKAENVDVLKADLKEGKTYLVLTNAAMGAFSAAAKFRVIDLKSEKQLKRIDWVFEKRKEATFTEEELKKGAEKNRFIIKKSQKKISKKLKKKKKHSVLEPDMYLELESL
ncbi:MAG: hypothetical protein JXQ93_04580 [Flavobacteriaceae bacterium]